LTGACEPYHTARDFLDSFDVKFSGQEPAAARSRRRYCAATAAVFGAASSSRRRGITGEQRDVGDGVGMVEKAALAEHQQIAEAADRIVQRLDLLVDVVRIAGKAGAALDQLLDLAHAGRL
jgi:hypothetical protein